MSDFQYGSNPGTPSSRPPEPPLRSGSWNGQPSYGAQQASPWNAGVPAGAAGYDENPAYRAATESVYGSGEPYYRTGAPGADEAGEVPPTGTFAPIASSDNTESFEAARSGDTDVMDRVGADDLLQAEPEAADPVAHDAADRPMQAGSEADAAVAADPVAVQPVAADPVAVQPVAAELYRLQPSAQADAAEQLRAQPQQRVGSADPYRVKPQRQAGTAEAYRRPQAETPRTASAAASGPDRAKGPSAGKTFLFGFLGALVACALAIGGFAFANGGFGHSTTTSALIGTTDQSVINAVDEGQTLAEAVAAKALPSVVAVYNYQNASSPYGSMFGYGYGSQGSDSLTATGMGSGVVISDDGYILTNYHVVEDADKLTVTVDGKERDAEYVGGDSSSDVAVIKVEDTEGLVAADIGDSDSLRIGEWVMTVGAPLGLEQSVATGVVSATNRDTVMAENSGSENDIYSYLYGSQAVPEYTYYPNMIQTDAVINPGNSGGALVDADGKLVGINTMISSYSGDYAGVGFALPVNYAIGIAQDIIDGKEPTHAILGVSISQVNSTIAQRYNLSSDTGAYISAISPDTGAADSDLQVGDIITAINGKAVRSTTDVTLDVRAYKVGDTVTVTVNRDGETVDVEVTLSSDENLKATDDQAESQREERNGRGDREGYDYDERGNGYSMEDIEELLRMLGM